MAVRGPRYRQPLTTFLAAEVRIVEIAEATRHPLANRGCGRVDEGIRETGTPIAAGVRACLPSTEAGVYGGLTRRRCWQDMRTRTVPVAGARLEVTERGAGEPVVFIQTALTADELLPLAADPALEDYRAVVYHRRGYAGSSPADGSGSITRDASDCVALLDQLGIDRAHLVGLSFSGAIALQLSADVPQRVQTLTLIEPPPVHVPSAHEFRAANERLLRIRREDGPPAALEEFLAIAMGPERQRAAEEKLPGVSAQMQDDAVTFFDTDLPALLDWEFGASDAARIRCPVLYVGGTDSGPWFAQVAELMRSWFPHADEAAVDGADHSLALTNPRQLAQALATFLQAHPS